MSASVSFVVMGKPVSWKRAGYNAATRQRFVDRGSESYRAIIREAARPHVEGKAIWLGKIRLELTAYFQKPEWPQWRDAWHDEDPEHYIGTLDADNLVKAVADSLQGVLFKNDNQLVDVRVIKMVAGRGERPRLELTLVEFEPKERENPDPRGKRTAAAGDLFAGRELSVRR